MLSARWRGSRVKSSNSGDGGVVADDGGVGRARQRAGRGSWELERSWWGATRLDSMSPVGGVDVDVDVASPRRAGVEGDGRCDLA